MTTVAAKLDIQKIKTKYRDRFLQMAYLASGWSPEPEGQRHGAVFALYGKYAVSISFNGPDRNWKSDSVTPGEGGCGGTCCHAPIEHAETNGLLNLRMIGVDPKDCAVFITKRPCGPCMSALQSSGVFMISWLQDLSSADSTWVRP